MRSFRFVNEIYVLGEDFVWSGPDEIVLEILNRDTETLINEYNIASGDPRAYVYETLLQRYPMFKKAVNDEKITASKGQLY